MAVASASTDAGAGRTVTREMMDRCDELAAQIVAEVEALQPAPVVLCECGHDLTDHTPDGERPCDAWVDPPVGVGHWCRCPAWRPVPVDVVRAALKAKGAEKPQDIGVFLERAYKALEQALTLAEGTEHEALDKMLGMVAQMQEAHEGDGGGDAE